MIPIDVIRGPGKLKSVGIILCFVKTSRGLTIDQYLQHLHVIPLNM